MSAREYVERAGAWLAEHDSSIRAHLVNDLAALLSNVTSEARDAERERCAKAVCEWCRDGVPLRHVRDLGGKTGHVFHGYPPRQCGAVAIRESATRSAP